MRGERESTTKREKDERDENAKTGGGREGKNERGRAKGLIKKPQEARADTVSMGGNQEAAEKKLKKGWEDKEITRKKGILQGITVLAEKETAVGVEWRPRKGTKYGESEKNFRQPASGQEKKKRETCRKGEPGMEGESGEKRGIQGELCSLQ